MHNTSDVVFTIQAGAVVALLGFAAWRDVVTRTIPDTVSILLLIVGSCARLAQGWQPFGMSLIVALAVFFSLVPLCIRGVLGGADLKLMAALAVGLSPQASFNLLADVTIAGGLLALLYLTLNGLSRILGARTQPRGRASWLLRRLVNIEFWRIRRRVPLPYGVAIAVGAACAVLNRQGV